MTTTEFKKDMKRINRLLDKADTIFNSLPPHVQDTCWTFHNEGSSLNHCLRWGLQASEELLREAKTVIDRPDE